MTKEQTCRCVRCGECNGTGTVWLSFGGQYLGSSRCDDLDEMETCSECRGSGISEECESCADHREMEQDANYDY